MKTFVILFFAILSEVIATSSLKYSEGFTKPIPSVVVVVGYGLSFYLLSIALKTMPIGVAYAIWSGVGTAVVAVIGMTVLGEEISTIKVVSLALIVVGVVGLNVSGAH